MDSGAPALLLLSLLCLPRCAVGCPAACRCYSATVECGALRLRVIPPGIPPGTQVGTLWVAGLRASSASDVEGRVCEPSRWINGAPFAQLEEFRDERGHEMFVIDRSKPLFAEGPAEAGEGTAAGPAQGLPLQPPAAYEIHC